MEHKDIVFSEWHNAKFSSGLSAAKPVSPSGLGDVYWATDTAILWLTNTAGSAWVSFSGAGSISLDSLSDVTITTPADGQALIYQTGTWVNGVTAITLTDLTDVDTTGLANNYILYYDNATTTWKVRLGSMANLTDANISSPAKGNVLVYYSGSWHNITVGSNGQVLTADSAQTEGIKWATNPSGVTTLAALTDVDLTTPAKGNVFVYDGTADWKNLATGSNGKVLTTDSTQPLGVKWATPSSGGGGTSALENAWTLIPAKPSVLANVPTTPSAIFTPTSGDTTRINSVVFYADHATDGQTITLYYYDGSSNIVLAEKYLPKAGSWVFKPDHPLLLPDTYQLRATSTNSSATKVAISGGYMTTPVTGLIPLHFYDNVTNGGTQTAYTVPTGQTAHLAHVIAHCYGATDAGNGADFTVAINDGVNVFELIAVCIRHGEYFVFDLGVNLDENWTVEIGGDNDMIAFWVDGAVTA